MRWRAIPAPAPTNMARTAKVSVGPRLKKAIMIPMEIAAPTIANRMTLILLFGV